MNRVNQNDFLAFPRPNGDGVNAVIVAKLGTNRSGGTPGRPTASRTGHRALNRLL